VIKLSIKGIIIFKHYKLYLIILTVFFLLVYSSWQYINFVISKRDALAESKHSILAQSMQEKASSMILQKQKSTVAIALTIALSNDLAYALKHRDINEEYFKELILKVKENTLYKNIWVQILDENLISLYKSWSDKEGSNLSNIRSDLIEIALTKKVTYSVSIGNFDLSIKAMVPIFSENKFLGIIEVISHFNSITQQLKKYNIDSAVVLKKEYKKQLTFPFTKLFIDDYYVANLDAPKKIRDYLKKHGVENYFNNSYKVENGYIIASYPIKNINAKILGYFVMFKEEANCSNMDLDFFMFKWLSVGLIVLMSIAIAIAMALFFAYKSQKKYYKNIIDSSKNIILVNNKKELLHVNKIFFKYFNRYKSFEDFKKEHKCICEFFVDEDGYLPSAVNNQNWVDYLLQNKSTSNIAKLDIFGKIYYFAISASKVLEGKNHYSFVLTDITIQENYNKNLEFLSKTDVLTNIGNRRFYQTKIKEEINSAKRYKYPLSLIMFDIDFFKQVNDKHGHGVGDEVLIEYSKLIASALRESDMLFRIGGEEFMIILTHTTKNEAQKVAEKLRVKVQDCKKVISITMSFGVVEYISGENEDHVFKRVDDALYKAKKSGRNIVIVG
jgi:diguanylate cyclase (GGDEF)-like protein